MKAALHRNSRLLIRSLARRHDVEPLSTAAAQHHPLRAVTERDVTHFRSILEEQVPGSRVLVGDDETEAYRTDWTGHYEATAGSVVLKPAETRHVQAITAFCHDQRIGIVPQAGNTGLVGGSVPVHEEVILSVKSLNEVESLDPVTGILRCQAGCILESVQEQCEEQGWVVPVNIGSRGSCCVGGLVATNAGGQYYSSQGSIAANLLGLQVCLADGRCLDLNYSNPLLKDNTGYKLHQLFVGSEGTLGVITGVAMQCHRVLPSRQVAVVACETFEDCMTVMTTARHRLGEILAAVEWMDHTCVETVMKHLSDSTSIYPVTKSEEYHPYYILIETQGSCEEHDQAKMESFLEVVMEETVQDGLLAQDETQATALWKVRESANPSAAAAGYTYKYDVSLAGSRFDDFIEEMDSRLSTTEVPLIQPNWGHLLDGNLHFNVTTPGNFEVDDQVLHSLEPYLFEAIQRRGGSISAEHGLGRAKNEYLQTLSVHDEATLSTMRAIKRLFDPHGILNPGKFLPTED